ncbi:hydroxyphenylacetyl-CoA thioesterase PaaI [Anderseniella sp. Alg231-50]|uniref:hydroxyphenylacetyl-CoA thioesterase PaaI n=1 Tax=Anderseniella sp. Alg231-50 TaxID=1922226 RepID=UPI000D555300
MTSSKDNTARACADALWANDNASQALGMRLVSVSPGNAELSMTVRPDMTNGHGTCHGGFIFTLADSAFAFACNTYDERTVAQHAQITFIAPAKAGDRLVATAVERSRTGRSGIYDITVTLESGQQIAEFRGHSRTVGGSIIEAS